MSILRTLEERQVGPKMGHLQLRFGVWKNIVMTMFRIYFFQFRGVYVE